MPTPEQWKQAISAVREPLPMEPELWAAGLSIDDAHFVARMLRQSGYYLVRPEDIGWPEINKFHDELRKGQSVNEDGGGFFNRAIMAMFGKKPDPIKSYQDAARELLASVK